MNRTYRIVQSRATGQWQVASEHARGRAKGGAPAMALAAVLALACAVPAAQAVAGAAVTGDVTPVVNWGDANDLIVGNTAAGSLQIEPPGAAVRSASGWLGLTTGGVGTAKVSGLGAYWIMNGSLVVGASGSGTLTLANHGSVTVGANGQGFAELARNPGAVGVINIGSAPGSTSSSPRMNLLPGRVTAAGKVALGERGHEVACATGSLAAGSKVTLGIRPEQVELVEAGSKDAVTLAVDVRELIEPDTLLIFQTGAGALTVRTQKNCDHIEGGQPVGLRFPREALHYFDASTGERLR